MANGGNAVASSDGGEPPMANPGIVLADSTARAAAGTAAMGTPGYVPSNATFNSGNGDNSANSGEGDTSSFWSSTKDKMPIENAYGHSTKHSGEFLEYQNSVQYVQAAQD